MSEEVLYNCVPDANLTCPEECTSLGVCDECGCAVEDTGGGPWGSAMDVILCLLPIIFLLIATLVPNPLPTTQSLPMAALIMFLVRTMYLGSDPLLCCAAIISGLHEALSPITIMGGAMLLFETMEATLCMPFMMREIKGLTNGHAISELMLIFCFAYMIEGASGFGTPVALSSPMLVSLGYPKFESVVTMLLMNTFATIYGAAGTPIWFGFGNLELSESKLIEISWKGGIALTFSAYLLMPFVLMYACSWKVLKQNFTFYLLSLSSCVGPSLGLSFVAYEFPSLIGGMIGCGLTSILIYKKVGLKEMAKDDDSSGRSHPMDIGSTSEAHSILKNSENDDEPKPVDIAGTVGPNNSVHIDKGGEEESGEANGDSIEVPEQPNAKEPDVEEPDVSKVQKSSASSFNMDDDFEKSSLRASDRAIEAHLGERKKVGEGYIKELIGRTFPLWGTVVILIVTRVPAIGLRDILTAKEPSFSIYFQTYGTFKCSASLVLQLENILTYPNINWKYELLYVPCLIPFALVSFITMFMYRKDLQSSPWSIIGVVVGRLKNPAIALFGALILVQLMIKDGSAAPASIIGFTLSEAFKEGWIAIAALIGALGSFFSGSTTISNLTFGEIQEIAAETTGLDTTAMLGLQAAGASAGNGVCLNNIISACTIVGLNVGEGKVIGKTFKIVLGFCVISTLAILAFFFRFK